MVARIQTALVVGQPEAASHNSRLPRARSGAVVTAAGSCCIPVTHIPPVHCSHSTGLARSLGLLLAWSHILAPLLAWLILWLCPASSFKSRPGLAACIAASSCRMRAAVSRVFPWTRGLQGLVARELPCMPSIQVQIQLIKIGHVPMQFITLFARPSGCCPPTPPSGTPAANSPWAP